MPLKVLLLGVLLGLLGSSCTTSAPQAVWPRPRPLGAEIPTYRPPAKPSHPAVTPQEAEPTGILRLSQAQALALMQNPELDAFTWEVRAREARTLQAVAYLLVADILSRPLSSRLRRLTQPVASPPNWFSTPHSLPLACIWAHRASRHPNPQPVACFRPSEVEATVAPGRAGPL